MAHFNDIDVTYHRVQDRHYDERYIVHFTDLRCKDKESYEEVLTRAKAYGGKKYKASWYAGGIVFRCDTYKLRDIILNLTK